MVFSRNHFLGYYFHKILHDSAPDLSRCVAFLALCADSELGAAPETLVAVVAEASGAESHDIS